MHTQFLISIVRTTAVRLHCFSKLSEPTEPPPTKVEGFSGLERLRRTVGSFPTEVGGFKPDFWKMKSKEV